MKGLYAILDVDWLEKTGFEILAFTEAVVSARPAAIQLRAKHLPADRTLALLKRMVPIAGAAGVPIFANDRADLAIAAGATGVHVGQNDPPPAVAQALGITEVGLSTHNQAQLECAMTTPIAYAAMGPVFATSSKVNPELTLGISELARLSSIWREARPEVPIVAIGGIGIERIDTVLPHVDMIAVISALLPPDALAGDDPRWQRAVTDWVQTLVARCAPIEDPE